MKAIVSSLVAILALSSLAMASDVISHTSPSAISADTMTKAAVSFYNSLSESQKQKITQPLDSEKISHWRFFPEPSKATYLLLPKRKGISLPTLTKEQSAMFNLLLAEGLSGTGIDAVNAALELDKDDSIKFRGLLNWILFSYGPKNYFVTFFGSPNEDTWAWRLEGHHVSINFSIQSGKIVSSYPLFIGTTKQQVLVGDKTITVLADVAAYAKQLATSLTSDQLAVASQSMEKVPMFNPVAPGIFGGGQKTTKPMPSGLPMSSMTANQQHLVGTILQAYQGQFQNAVAAANLQKLAQNGMDNLELIWEGDVTMEKPFYFRIQGPNFVLEFNTSEGHADHYHTAWIVF
jgi:hypothetical protein